MDKALSIVIGIVVAIIIALALITTVSNRIHQTSESGERVTNTSDSVLSNSACKLKCDSCQALYSDADKINDCVNDERCDC